MKLSTATISSFLVVVSSTVQAKNLRVQPSLQGAVLASDLNAEYSVRKEKKHPPVDAIKLFNILTSNNNIIVGDLPESIPYSMPNNIKLCQESFNIEDRSAEYLTNPPPSLPPTYSEDGKYEYVQYKEDSSFGRELQTTTIDRTDDLMEQLYQAGMIQAFDIPALMFDIDNTMAYTAYNDSDFTGDAPPLDATVRFVQKWCDGWGSGDRAQLQCIFITARYCTELNAKATSTWLKKTYDASDELISTNVQFSGSLKCSCCDNSSGNIAYKDILRKDWIDMHGLSWVASVGDQLTDSVGHYSGIKIKLPNVWFDSSMVPNQFTQGDEPKLNSNGFIVEEEWTKQCDVKPQAPIAPGPSHCLNPDALRHARENASFDHCLAQTRDKAPNQVWGCDVDISTGHKKCKL